jgi:hypothetical protein
MISNRVNPNKLGEEPATSPIWNYPGLNTGLWGKKPASNHFSYATAHSLHNLVFIQLKSVSFGKNQTRTAKKTMPQTILRCRENVFTKPLRSNDRGYTDPQTLFRYDTDRTKNDASNNYSIVACIRRCGNVFTEPLASNDRGMHI